MKMKVSLMLFLMVAMGSVIAQTSKKVLHQVKIQSQLMLKELTAYKDQHPGTDLVSPRTITENGSLKLVSSKDWTSGFFPGVLWYLYSLSGEERWQQAAISCTAPIEREKLNGTTHDMGFKIYCSFGTGYRITHDPHYKEVILQSAKTLATRFNPKVGAIRSWDHHEDQWKFPVIIDNMMNLELLFEASKLSGDSSYYKIAVAHANTTMKNHFRPDYSCYHVVDYDPETGKVLHQQTHQGYSDASSWARGQAWALYGYTMCYRETKDKRYLEQAEGVAHFIFNNKHLPKDLVPYWDFDAPGIPNEPRDVSAATVIASALLELSTYSVHKDDYQLKANTILKNVFKKYRSKLGSNDGFILSHSTGSKPSNSEVDVPLSYADYYYLEAIKRAENIKQHLPVLKL